MTEHNQWYTTIQNTHHEAHGWRFNVNVSPNEKWIVNLLKKDPISQKTTEKYDLSTSSEEEFIHSFVPWICSIAINSPEHEQFCSEVISNSNKLFPQFIINQIVEYQKQSNQ